MIFIYFSPQSWHPSHYWHLWILFISIQLSAERESYMRSLRCCWLINMQSIEYSQKSIIPENSGRFLSWGQVCGCQQRFRCSAVGRHPCYFFSFSSPLDSSGRVKKGLFYFLFTRMGTDRALLPHDLSFPDTKWLKSQSNRNSDMFLFWNSFCPSSPTGLPMPPS